MTLDDRLARLERLLRRPERGWSLIPLEAQAQEAWLQVRALRAALAMQREKSAATEGAA